MAVKIRCPEPDCAASYRVAEEKLGRTVRCKKCGRRFSLVPDTRGDSPQTSTISAESPYGDGPAGPDLPTSFGRYRIIRKLGRGGMGAVYLAQDTQLEREVALKVPHIAIGDRPELQGRFFREARAAAQFRHPNFCPIHDTGVVDGVHFLTMAFIEGETLASMIARDGAWPQRRSAEVVRQLALALAEAHHRGIIHRDLKPSNVMLDHRGTLIIMDFGLALRVDAADPRITATGAVIGTPAYMPPEQVEGHQDAIGPRSDIYSLGVILYELLTSRRPFEGPATKVFGLILFAEPPRPSTYRPDLDPRLEAICLKAIAKKAEDRYASMDEFAEALRAGCEAGERPYSNSSATTERKSTIFPGKLPDPVTTEVRFKPALTETASTGLPNRRGGRFRISVKAWGISVTLVCSFSIALLAFMLNREGLIGTGPDADKAIALLSPAPDVTRPRPASEPEPVPEVPPPANSGLSNMENTLVPPAPPPVASPPVAPAPPPPTEPDDRQTAATVVGRGGDLLAKREYALAITAFSRAIRLDPSNADAFANRGLAHIARGDLDQAIADANQAIRLRPDHAAAFDCRGRAWLDKGNIDLAIADTTRALQINPDLADARDNMGRIWIARKQYDRAIEEFDRAIQLAPKYADAYVNRGRAYHARGEFDRAIADFRQAIQLEEDHPHAYVNRGLAYHAKGNHAMAIADFTEALDILDNKPDPTEVDQNRRAQAHKERGRSRAENGQRDKAIEDYSEAIRLNPRFADAYDLRGIARYIAGDHDGAIADYTEAIRHDSKHPNAYENRGLVWEVRRDHVRAIADYTEAIRLDEADDEEDEPLAYERLAWILATSQNDQLRDGPRAVELATRACQMKKWQDPFALDILAAAQAETGQFAEAVRTETQAIELLKDEPTRENFRARLALYRSERKERIPDR